MPCTVQSSGHGLATLLLLLLLLQTRSTSTGTSTGSISVQAELLNHRCMAGRECQSGFAHCRRVVLLHMAQELSRGSLTAGAALRSEQGSAGLTCRSACTPV